MNPELLIKFDGKKVEKNGKVYMKPENTRLSFTTTRIYMRLDNLYNGDKVHINFEKSDHFRKYYLHQIFLYFLQALGESTNAFLNDSWNEVFPEIRKSVFDALSQIVESYLSNVFTKIPYNELFAEGK